MQLTILLNLIHSVGYSLPDQRTDLYKQYVDLFLNREAEKTPSVREHRQVLVGFIQHLAWTLQAQAESENGSGSISEDELKIMVNDYVQDGAFSTQMADDLFSSALERIFVLVQRIEGLYEFEVQPLREFFCARHLYETAPVGTYRNQSPAGDRSQRFEAIVRNPFWLNVTRFYAGSFEMGELAGLVSSMKQLLSEGDIPTGVQARRVSMALLSDWVFSSRRFVQDDLIRLVFDDLGIDLLASSNDFGDVYSLPIECGQEALRNLLFARLLRSPAGPRASLYALRIAANGGAFLRANFEAALLGLTESTRTSLLRCMHRSGATSGISDAEMWSLLTADSPSRFELIERVQVLMAPGPVRFDHGVFAKFLLDAAVDSCLGDGGQLNTKFGQLLSLLSLTVDPRYVNIDRHSTERTERSLRDGFSIDSKATSLIAAFDELMEGQVSRGVEIEPSLDLNRSVVELIRTHYGEHWSAFSLALRSAGIRTKNRATGGNLGLFDRAVPLVDRARSARLRRGGRKWWEDQLANAVGGVEKMFWVGMVLTWSPTRVVDELIVTLETVVSNASEIDLARLRACLRIVYWGASPRADRPRGSVSDLSLMSSELASLYVFAYRCAPLRSSFSESQLEFRSLRDWMEAESVRDVMTRMPGLTSSSQSKQSVESWLDFLRDRESDDQIVPRIGRARLRRMRLPRKRALEILSQPHRYPIDVVGASEYSLQMSYRPTTLSAESHSGGWTFM